MHYLYKGVLTGLLSWSLVLQAGTWRNLFADSQGPQLEEGLGCLTSDSNGEDAVCEALGARWSYHPVLCGAQKPPACSGARERGWDWSAGRGGAGQARRSVLPPAPVPLSFALPPFWCRRAAAGEATLLALGLAGPVPRTARKAMDVLGWLLPPLLLLCTQPHHGAR